MTTSRRAGLSGLLAIAGLKIRKTPGDSTVPLLASGLIFAATLLIVGAG